MRQNLLLIKLDAPPWPAYVHIVHATPHITYYACRIPCHIAAMHAYIQRVPHPITANYFKTVSGNLFN